MLREFVVAAESLDWPWPVCCSVFFYFVDKRKQNEKRTCENKNPVYRNGTEPRVVYNENTQIIIIWKSSLALRPNNNANSAKMHCNLDIFSFSALISTDIPTNTRKKQANRDVGKRGEDGAEKEKRSSDGRFLRLSSRIKMLWLRAGSISSRWGYCTLESLMLTVFTHKSTLEVARIIMEFL